MIVALRNENLQLCFAYYIVYCQQYSTTIDRWLKSVFFFQIADNMPLYVRLFNLNREKIQAAWGYCHSLPATTGPSIDILMIVSL